MAKEPSHDLSARTMFVCMPLRLGVLLCSLITFLSSVLYVLNRPFWEYMFRRFTGGYCLASKTVVGGVQLSGLLFGLMGMMGAWNCRRSYISTLNLWQYACVISWVFIYYVDIPLLVRCEDWVNNVQQMTDRHGWNPELHKVAMAGECGSERSHFLAISALALLVSMYIAHATGRYQELLEGTSGSLVQAGAEDVTSGAFYSHSLGERNVLDGAYGSFEQELGASERGHMLSPAVGFPPSKRSARFASNTTFHTGMSSLEQPAY